MFSQRSWTVVAFSRFAPIVIVICFNQSVPSDLLYTFLFRTSCLYLLTEDSSYFRSMKTKANGRHVIQELCVVCTQRINPARIKPFMCSLTQWEFGLRAGLLGSFWTRKRARSSLTASILKYKSRSDFERPISLRMSSRRSSRGAKKPDTGGTQNIFKSFVTSCLIHDPLLETFQKKSVCVCVRAAWVGACVRVVCVRERQHYVNFVHSRYPSKHPHQPP